MSDIARLKDELHTLSCHIQAERNEEARHGLMRIRMERERTEIMVKLIDAYGAAVTPADLVAHEPPPEKPTPAPACETPNGRQKRKPDGLPTIVEMVVAVLEGEEDGMRPRDITAIARRKWWPELRGAAVNAVMWKLAGEGRLEKHGHHYRLNGHAGG
jgi:hypothetical protein